MEMRFGVMMGLGEPLVGNVSTLFEGSFEAYILNITQIFLLSLYVNGLFLAQKLLFKFPKQHILTAAFKGFL